MLPYFKMYIDIAIRKLCMNKHSNLAYHLHRHLMCKTHLLRPHPPENEGHRLLEVFFRSLTKYFIKDKMREQCLK